MTLEYDFAHRKGRLLHALPNLTDPKVIEAVQFIHDMVYEYKVAPTPGTITNTEIQFINGEIGMFGALQIFEQPQILTNGGPGDATRTIVMYVYEQGFRFFDMGYASTVALSLFVIILILTAIQFRLSRRWVFYQ